MLERIVFENGVGARIMLRIEDKQIDDAERIIPTPTSVPKLKYTKRFHPIIGHYVIEGKYLQEAVVLSHMRYFFVM